MKDASRQLLVIDDDPTDRELIVRLLGESFVIVQAATGKDGLDLVHKIKPHCVLLDYRLPDMYGLDVLKILLQFGTPVVMLTGEGDEHVAVDAMKAGAFDYLQKRDLEGSRLAASIGRAIEKTEMLRRLDAARKELEDFVSVASHDLKSPLATIGSYLNIALEEMENELGDKTRSCIEKSAALAEDLRKMVDHLIRYTQVGRGACEFTETDLSQTALNARKRIEGLLQEANVRVEIGRLPEVTGVSTDLVQLFQNLLSNAIKHNDAESPSIGIEAQLVGQEWLVSVSDNGPGVPEEHRETIFAPLMRLNNEQSGYGLGLATCRKIVAQHGGRIWVEAGPKRGSSFRFALPATPSQIAKFEG